MSQGVIPKKIFQAESMAELCWEQLIASDAGDMIRGILDEAESAMNEGTPFEEAMKIIVKIAWQEGFRAALLAQHMGLVKPVPGSGRS